MPEVKLWGVGFDSRIREDVFIFADDVVAVMMDDMDACADSFCSYYQPNGDCIRINWSQYTGFVWFSEQ